MKPRRLTIQTAYLLSAGTESEGKTYTNNLK